MGKVKKLKGFTLVELIVVMAIFAIFMSAIAVMVKPITNVTFVAVDYDTQRTVANEINVYTCQSIKYATYARVYTDCKQLPNSAITDFQTMSGVVNNDIRVVAVINDFTGAINTTRAPGIEPNEYNGTATASDFGRVFCSEYHGVSDHIVTYYTSMGKWFYGRAKYQIDISFNAGIINITTDCFEDGDKGLTVITTSKFLNYSPTKMPDPILGSGGNVGKNTYIVYTVE